MKVFFSRSVVAFGLVAMACGLGADVPNAHSATLKGFMWICGNDRDVKRMCWWHKAVFTPPPGWSEDLEWTNRYKSVVMFPNGNRSKSRPVMYVRAHAGDKDLALEHYIEVAQQRWKASVQDTTIAPLDDFAREGKPGFKVYLYKNPSHPEQAFELTAFMKDVDAAHPEQTYFFQVVLSSPSMKEVEKAKPAFFEVLNRL